MKLFTKDGIVSDNSSGVFAVSEICLLGSQLHKDTKFASITFSSKESDINIIYYVKKYKILVYLEFFYRSFFYFNFTWHKVKN